MEERDGAEGKDGGGGEKERLRIEDGVYLREGYPRVASAPLQS